MNFLNHMKVLHRFLLLAAIAVLIAAIPTVLFVRERLILIDTLQLEQQGLTPVRSLLGLTQQSQRHRGLSAMVLNGDTPARDKQRSVAKKLDASFADLASRLQHSMSPQALLELQQIMLQWNTLRDNAAGSVLSSSESFVAHSELIVRLTKLANRVAEQSGLDLDSVAESRHLIEASIDNLWAFAESLAKIRGIGSGLMVNSFEEPGPLLALGQQLTDGQRLLDRTNANFDIAFAHSPAAKIRLTAVLQSTNQAAKTAMVQSADLVLAKGHPAFAADDYFAAMTQAVDSSFELMDSSLAMVDDILSERLAGTKRVLFIMLGAFLLLLLLGITSAWLIARSLTRQLGGEPNDMVRWMLRVSQGDLTATLPQNHKQDPQQDHSSMQSMVVMQSNLQKMVQEVRSGAEHMVNASSQIAAGNMDLSERTERQASALEQTSSSTEQLMGTVRQNADNSSQANELALKASDMVVHGGDQVAKVVSTMDGINQSSRKIIDIISVIDGIAFQTNILALNAAVEAARAGEQGRGFAVVASEVRNLAQRSAVAAKEIKLLIGDSMVKVEEGSRQVALTGATMEGVVASVKRVTLIMSEVNTASHEQSTGIEQVNLAINQMEQITQQNAALVEEAAAASDELKHQARGLQELVSRFQLPGDSNRPPVPRLTETYVAPTPAIAVSLQRLGGNASSGMAKLRQNGKLSAQKPVPAAFKSDEWEEF